MSEPADGFFVSGSSIEGMNGVYIRRNPPRLKKDDSMPSTGASALYYKHEDGLWAMTLNELPPRSDVKEDEEERDDYYYFSRYHRKKPETHVWFFEDAFGKQRFQHKGDTIIPGAGTSWKHVPLAGFSIASVDVDSDEDDRVPYSSYFGSAFTNTKPSQDTSALAEMKEADEEELPWQVIAILDKEMVHQLCYSSEYRKKKVRDAVAGKNAPPPPKNSLEGCYASGGWIFRVIEESILRVSSSEDSEAVGTRHCGEYLRGIKLGGGGDWLCLDSCEDLSADTPLRSGRRSTDRFFNMELARRQLWVQLKDASGAPLLVEVAQEETPVFDLQGVGDVRAAAADTESSSSFTDSSSSTGVSKVAEESDPEADGGAGLTGDMFDKPFVPRVESSDAAGPSSEQQLLLVTIKGGVEDDVLRQVRVAAEQRHGSVCVVPLGSAVEVYGLVSRSGAPYNGVTGVVVALAKDGRQGVRLDAPFSGKVLACKVLTAKKRTFCLKRSSEWVESR